MHRRDLLKALAWAGVPWHRLRATVAPPQDATTFTSAWTGWPDGWWAGPEYWANRLQDWRVAGGRVECLLAGRHRTLHLLTHRLGDARAAFVARVTVARAAREGAAQAGRGNAATAGAVRDTTAADRLGLRLGAKGPRDDVRSAAVYGRGLDVGLDGDGRLRIGDATSGEPIAIEGPVRLEVRAEPAGAAFRVSLTATAAATGAPLATLVAPAVSADALTGTVALLSHVDAADAPVSAAAVAVFTDWALSGPKVEAHPTDAFGPVAFAQYTLHRGTLKLTAQLLPIERMPGHRIVFEVRRDGAWRPLAEPAIDPISRTAHVRVDDWHDDAAVPYRLRVVLPVGGTERTYTWDGTVAREPSDRNEVRVATFSCNADHGFPDVDVPPAVAFHRPDLALFLGDQFYEGSGGFGIERAPLERSSLDYLRKWYQFGWSYREIFRHIPSITIPDDHDVYHGNIWGEGGASAPTDRGWGYVAQDQGGYKMEPAWVNLVQRCQTSHLPDPYDPTPVAQGIGVYYTHWSYAGLSFAILEDRKFKSAPRHVLPAEARVVNGFATNPAFDLRAHREPPGAELLGARQERFLEAWVDDLSRGAAFRVVVSQTPFCAVHTLPAGSTSDEAVPGLPMPAPGEYVTGDAPAGDMDTNGWPQGPRDAALRIIRRANALHLAGDQHLATVVRYGIDAHDDAGWAFTGPALNNIWPRRWWPPREAGHQPVPGGPAYTGRFEDAFGNRVTVQAAANPRKTGRDPAILHDRVTGYGIVVFDRAAGTVRIECWPRGVDPAKGPGGQYDGWPVVVAPGRGLVPAGGGE
ncbi:MAG: alkaline phosphatase D family protein [Vicinamibacterales bacterium]